MAALKLQGLLDLKIDFDLGITGFEMGEIDVLLGAASNSEPEDVELPDPEGPVVSQKGDL